MSLRPDHDEPYPNGREHAPFEEKVSVSQQAVALFRCWGKLDPSLIDSDFAPDSQYEFQIDNLYDVKAALTGIRQQLVEEDPTPPTMSSRYALHAKLAAASYALEYQLPGIKPDLIQVVDQTMGIELGDYTERIRARTIEVQRRVEAYLRENYGGGYEEAARQFVADHKISADEYVESMKEKTRSNLSALEEFLGVDLPIEVEPKVIKDKDTWTASSTRDGKTSEMVINANAPLLLRGDGEVLWLHELTHLVNFELVSRRIENGEVEPALGITTLQEPRLYASEGLATTIQEAVPGLEFSDLGRFNADRRKLRNLVYYLAHLRANAPDYNQAAVIRSIQKRYPFDTAETVAKDLELRGSHKVNRGYNIVYPVGEMDYQKMITTIKGIDTDGSRMRTFIRGHLENILVPEQVAALFSEVKRRQPPAARTIYSGPVRESNGNGKNAQPFRLVRLSPGFGLSGD